MNKRLLVFVWLLAGVAQLSSAESHDAEGFSGRPEASSPVRSLRNLRSACEPSQLFPTRSAPIPAPLPPPPPPVVAPAPPPAPPAPSPTPIPSTTPAPRESDWEALLKHHNEERAAVSVPPLRWSDKLAKQAQEWANKCDFNHNPNLGNSGQNLYVTSNTRESIDDGAKNASKGWGDEKAHYNARTNTCATDEVCGHYTQMVWRSTTEVGCAIARCNGGVRSFDTTGRASIPGTIVVCDYGPAGNVVGQRPY